MRSRLEELTIRSDVFRWLDERFDDNGGLELSRDLLESYKFQGKPIKLLDTGRSTRDKVRALRKSVIMVAAVVAQPSPCSNNQP